MTRVPMNTIATRLINEAQAAVVTPLIGTTVTESDLPTIAARVHAMILTQAALGQWRELGVVDPDDLLPLRVTAKFGNALTSDPPIKVLYNFTHTRLASLVVSAGVSS